VGDTSAALQYAARAVAIDRLREEAHHELIRLYAAAGQSATALRRFRDLEDLLAKELGASPSAATRQLAREIELVGRASHPGPSNHRPTRQEGDAPVEAAPDPDEPGTAMRIPAPEHPAPPLSLPTGTVTFLLTEITGAAVLREQAAETFERVLASHQALLRREFGRYGGHEVRHAPDSIVAAFAAATDAVAGAVAGQRALAAHSRPEEMAPLPVRLALNTGDVALEAGHYRGPVLDHAARILVAAHGGQILCSEVTAGLLRHSGPGESATNVMLTDLGVYRLRGLPAPPGCIRWMTRTYRRGNSRPPVRRRSTTGACRSTSTASSAVRRSWHTSENCCWTDRPAS
jgi:class 3 adenylate cyclase